MINDNDSDNDKWVKWVGTSAYFGESKIDSVRSFVEHLNIEVQMAPYFGRHSCKMFIRRKPMHFWQKNQALPSDCDYTLRVIPYQRKSINGNQVPLGFRVVKELLEVVNDDKWQDVYFDNLFTFLSLLEDLQQQQSILATIKMRVGRLQSLPLLSLKVMEKKQRGKMNFCRILNATFVKIR